MQPLAALYPTVRLSPWRQVWKNIHSMVWTPCPTWSVPHPAGGPPLLVPLSSLVLTPGDWSGLVSGWLSPVPLDLVSPQEGFSPGPLTPRLPPEFCSLPFACFLCGTWHRTFMRKHCQLEKFIKTIYRSSYCTVSAKDVSLVYWFLDHYRLRRKEKLMMCVNLVSLVCDELKFLLSLKRKPVKIK